MHPSTRSGRLVALATSVALMGLSGGCAIPVRDPKLHEVTSPPNRAESHSTLKVHMKSGELVVLDTWKVSNDRSQLEGHGVVYSATRARLATGARSIPVADIALLETNAPSEAYSGGVAVLGLLTVVLGSVTGLCVASPKSCFGSCPTFYLDGDADEIPVAEGFSSSIARTLEARDVDAIFRGRPTTESQLVVTVRNEALETHAIRRLRVLAAPMPAGGRVLADPSGSYHEAFDLTPPISCSASEGDCRAAVAAWDDAERSSPADGADLAAREEIDLVFPAAEGELGLVLGARQSLLSTYLFYQTMAHFGSRAGQFLAAVEQGGPAARQALAMARVLGGIEAFVDDGHGTWHPMGEFDEAGPIAGDVRALPFQSTSGGPIRVRLRLTKGHWRLGYVALAHLGQSVVPEALLPSSVDRNGRRDQQAEAIWAAGTDHVVTLPGDLLHATFALPRPAEDLELFIESEGFYYEWMREEWLSEEDPGMALLSLTHPREALRRLAGRFKEKEATMDEAFWASRFRSVR